MSEKRSQGANSKATPFDFGWVSGGRRETPEPTVRRRIWSLSDIVTVVTRYAAEGPSVLAKELGRSEDSVSGLARRFGQRTPRKPYRRTPGRRPRGSTA
jgi:hypothetical protein